MHTMSNNIMSILDQARQLNLKLKFLNLSPSITSNKLFITYALKVQQTKYVCISPDELEDAYVSIVLKQELDEVIDLTLKNETSYIAIGIKDGQMKLICGKVG